MRAPCDGKGISLRLPLLSSYHPDLLVRDDPREEKESLQFLWGLVLCLRYPVTYGLHRKNVFTTTEGRAFAQFTTRTLHHRQEARGTHQEIGEQLHQSTRFIGVSLSRRQGG